MPKRPVKLQTYAIVADAVDAGIRYGWNRAHKHTDKPTEEIMKEAIYDAVMLNLDEVIRFE